MALYISGYTEDNDPIWEDDGVDFAGDTSSVYIPENISDFETINEQSSPEAAMPVADKGMVNTLRVSEIE